MMTASLLLLANHLWQSPGERCGRDESHQPRAGEVGSVGVGDSSPI
jgi:hypothetical protein